MHEGRQEAWQTLPLNLDQEQVITVTTNQKTWNSWEFVSEQAKVRENG